MVYSGNFKIRFMVFKSMQHHLTGLVRYHADVEANASGILKARVRSKLAGICMQSVQSRANQVA